MTRFLKPLFILALLLLLLTTASALADPSLTFIPENPHYPGQTPTPNYPSSRKRPHIRDEGRGKARGQTEIGMVSGPTPGQQAAGEEGYHIMGLSRPIPLRPSSPFPTLLPQSHGTGPVGWCRPLTIARRRCPRPSPEHGIKLCPAGPLYIFPQNSYLC